MRIWFYTFYCDVLELFRNQLKTTQPRKIPSFDYNLSYCFAYKTSFKQTIYSSQSTMCRKETHSLHYACLFYVPPLNLSGGAKVLPPPPVSATRILLILFKEELMFYSKFSRSVKMGEKSSI